MHSNSFISCPCSFYPIRSDRRVPSSTPRPLPHSALCPPGVPDFQISASVRHANPPSRQLRKFTHDEFLSCDTFLLFLFLFCYLWVLLFWCFRNDTTCPLLEIHDVTWAIRLIGAL